MGVEGQEGSVDSGSATLVPLCVLLLTCDGTWMRIESLPQDRHNNQDFGLPQELVV